MSVVNALATELAENTIANKKHKMSKSDIRRLRLTFIQIVLHLPHHSSEKEIARALRNKQLADTPANIEGVLHLSFAIGFIRKNRALVHARSRNPTITELPLPTGRAPVKLRPGHLVDRLYETRRLTLKNYAFNVIRHGAPGGSSFKINFATTRRDVNYQIDLGRPVDVYRDAFKGGAANVDHHTATIPRDWRVRVQRQGLANLGGMLTLDAYRLESPQGLEIFAAVWVVQTRDYVVKVERGYIVLAGKEHCHAATIETAIRGIQAKCQAGL